MKTRKRFASLVSSILNPFSVSLVLILLLSFRATAGVLDALRWSLVFTALSILPVFSVMIYLVRKGRLDSIFTSDRRQRAKIYLVASFWAAVGWAAFSYLGAPSLLVAAFAAGFFAVVVFMCINLWWKISLHTAFIAGSVTALVIVYGGIAAVTLVLVLLISWARTALGYHSLAQVAAGASLAAFIVAGVFYLFGLV